MGRRQNFGMCGYVALCTVQPIIIAFLFEFN